MGEAWMETLYLVMLGVELWLVWPGRHRMELGDKIRKEPHCHGGVNGQHHE